MDSILMRTMTRKSIIGFGYQDVRDLSVGQLIDSGRIKFLIRAYFGLDKINYTEDVLIELGIIKEFRITKPGKVDLNKIHENYTKCIKNLGNNSEKHIMGRIMRKRKLKRLHKKNNETKLDKASTKIYLKSKNQGKL